MANYAKPKREYYLVRVDRPNKVGKRELAGYIQEAVAGWKGQFEAIEPLSELDGETVKVKRFDTNRTAALQYACKEARDWMNLNANGDEKALEVYRTLCDALSHARIK